MVTQLRAAQPEDAAAILAIYRPYIEQGTVTFELEVPSLAAMTNRIVTGMKLYPWLVAHNAAGVVIGYAYAGSFRERLAYRFTCETSIYITQAAQGQGIGRRLYGCLLETLKAQNFTQAMGVIALPNHGSIALHEGLGFQQTGIVAQSGYKLEQWVDIGLWQCPLAKSHVPPPEIIPFPDMRFTPQ